MAIVIPENFTQDMVKTNSNSCTAEHKWKIFEDLTGTLHNDNCLIY